MAIWRAIHKDLFKNEELSTVPIEARMLYTGTIVFADDEGRMKASASFLKITVFPYDEKVKSDQVRRWRDALANTGLIQIYVVDGKEYLVHPKYDRWQQLRKDRPKATDCPPPIDGQCLSDDGQCHAIPYHTIPHKTIPNQTTPNKTTPNQTTPQKTTQASVVTKDRFHDHVLLTKDEYFKLIHKYGETLIDKKIEDLNNYIGSKGKKYKSHYHTLLMWIGKEGTGEAPRNKGVHNKPL